MKSSATFSKLYKKFLKPKDVDYPYQTQAPQTPSDFLIDLRNVVKKYQTPAGEFTALRNIDLQVKAGEFTAIIGKSGSGKSTLINMITGIDRPTLGEVIVNGMPIHTLNEDQMAAWRAHNLSVVFQFFQMLPTLTLVENVQMPMLISRRYPRAERMERALHLLDLVGMADQADKFPSEVSGGQQQRAAIARALANDPKILIADEPTGSLDSKTGDSIFRLFEDFVSEGRTILMVTHDRSLASRTSRVVFIADGEIVDEQVSTALPGLNHEQQINVLSQLETESFDPGEDIVRQGDVADTFYIITHGEVEVVMHHASGQKLMLDRLKAGQYFGEIGLLEKGIRTATVRAASDAEVTVMQLNRDVFIQMMHESNLTLDQMAQMVRQRAIEINLKQALPALPKNLVIDISQKLSMKTYSPGETLVKQGDLADTFYILSEGVLEVTKTLPNGQERVIAHLQQGQIFGEMGLTKGGTRTATVRVVPGSEATVMEINAKTFVEMKTASKLTSEQIAALIQQRLIGQYVSQALPTLSMDLLMRLPGDLALKHYPTASTIISRGDQATTFYIIAQGSVDVIEMMTDGSPIVIEQLGPGEFFGEIGLLQAIPQPVTFKASATEGATVVPIEQALFTRLLDQSEATHQAIDQGMQQRLAESLES
ncbi:MAG: cyclic nucleotide-binding domain-containing protein [Chloroflexota bacterium]